MPIRETSPHRSFQEAIDRRLNAILSSLVRQFCYAGESAIRHARNPNRKRYTDQTGNLTSSIGYVVLLEGRVVEESDFSPVTGTRQNPGLSGSKRGREFLHQLIAEYSSGLVLIVVAGMPYSVYVEAMGLDVLDSAEIKANEIVKRMLSKIRF